MKSAIYLMLLLLLWMGNGYPQEPDLGTEAQREAGRKLYMEKCAQCHGEKGDGQGVARRVLRPEPRDFTSGIFKFRTTASGELPTVEDLRRSIRKGMPYTAMPAWPDLSDEQVNNLVYFIKTFSPDFAGPYGTPTPLNIPDPPAFSEESAQRGRIVYEENQCLDCHGNRGRGDGKSAPTLKDQWEQPIRPADLTKRWTFRGGSTRKDIFRTFTTGLDGSPMPSYSIDPPSDQWALVDYVYSLSRDEPNYANVVRAVGTRGELDISRGADLFQNAPEALFPVVGQVIEPGREFHPGVNAVAVKAVYNEDEIALMLSWHDMVADRTGSNGPDMPVPLRDPGQAAEDSQEEFSDAVAVQFPQKLPTGPAKPYFLLGDDKNPVQLWFMDLAGSTARIYQVKGRGNFAADEAELSAAANFDEGEWTVIFKRPRGSEEDTLFAEGQFVPIAFSLWDGFNDERGNKRGITSWYHLYLEPLERESPLGPMVKYGLLTFLVEIGIIFMVRRKYKGKV